MQSIMKYVLAVFHAACMLSAIPDPYGKFDLVTRSVESCRGPRHRDCGHFIYKVLPGNRLLEIQVDVREFMLVNMVRIVGQKTESKTKSKPIIDLKLDSPCESPVLRKIFENMLLESESTCRVKKGQYNYTLDTWRLAQKIWAGSFFYGNFTLKSTYYGPSCNLGCSIANVTFTPRP